MQKFQQLKDHVFGMESDFEKFAVKGNKAAGTRIRKGLQELKQLAQDIRADVQSRKSEG
jgi:hypothetical protein